MGLPKYIGIIPDGDRRWAKSQGMGRSEGYIHEISPGMSLYRACQELGIGEMSFYGFAIDSTKRPPVQRQAFTKAYVAAIEGLAKENASLLMLGNTKPPMLPQELLSFTVRHDFGKGGTKINFLMNYNWERDLGYKDGAMGLGLRTSEVSEIDLTMRWGGRRRPSGLLPVQSMYSDFYVVDDYWPDFKRKYVKDTLKWYAIQDIVLEG